MDLKGIFRVIKFKGFIENYTTLNILGGVYQRFSGKGTGAKSKTKDLTDDDRQQIAIGLKKLAVDLSKIADAEISNLKPKK